MPIVFGSPEAAEIVKRQKELFAALDALNEYFDNEDDDGNQFSRLQSIRNRMEWAEKRNLPERLEDARQDMNILVGYLSVCIRGHTIANTALALEHIGKRKEAE